MAKAMLTDSGLETWLVFHRGIELPCFASFPLLDDPAGRDALTDYFRDHLRVAKEAGVGIVLETPTWRANTDWGAKLGYDVEALDRVNRESVHFLRGLAAEFDGVDVIVSGTLGPRGDAYRPEELLTPEVAEAYHRAQIDSLVAAGADRVTFFTATHIGEAIGVVRVATAAGIPVIVSFTVETDGRIPSGMSLAEAIEVVDTATDSAAMQFGINCAHPDHFAATLQSDSPAINRVQMIRANASRASHAELDEADVLDDGDPEELGAQFARLLADHPQLSGLGGCCGTDVRHIEAIARACFAAI